MKKEEKFLDILKEYLKKYNCKAIGYSDEEIIQLEKLHDIELKGDLREFMKIAGRSSGGLIGDDPIILYRNLWSIRSQIDAQIFFRKVLEEKNFYEESESKPFYFSMEYETQDYFVKTKDNDLIVYHFDDNCDTLESTNMTFNEYMINVLRRYNPGLEPGRVTCTGELLIKFDEKQKRG